MLWIRMASGIAGAVLLAVFSVAQAQAQESPASVASTERRIFYLDRGFVGRAVSLDLDNDNVNVSWEAGDLAAPTILYVEISHGTTSTINGSDLGATTVQLIWADPYLLSERGVKIGIKDGCVIDNWHKCTSFIQTATGWKETSDGWAYGRATVRGGTKQLTYMQSGDASWYKYKGCRCAASVDFPKGTRLLVRRADRPEKFTVVRVNDYGPERDKFPERAIDLDAVAFSELVSLRAGVIQVLVEPITPSHPLYAMADSLPSTTTQVALSP